MQLHLYLSKLFSQSHCGDRLNVCNVSTVPESHHRYIKALWLRLMNVILVLLYVVYCTIAVGQS